MAVMWWKDGRVVGLCVSRGKFSSGRGGGVTEVLFLFIVWLWSGARASHSILIMSSGWWPGRASQSVLIMDLGWRPGVPSCSNHGSGVEVGPGVPVCSNFGSGVQAGRRSLL